MSPPEKVDEPARVPQGWPHYDETSRRLVPGVLVTQVGRGDTVGNSRP